MAVSYWRVGDFPPPDVSIDASERWPHPRTIGNLIGVDDAAHFPLLDSRTRYWRYYVIYRPWDERQTLKALGRLLHQVIRRNDRQHDSRAPQRRIRGIGRRLYEPRRNLTSHQEKQVARGFSSAYRTAVRRFWEKVKARGQDHVFSRASARWRSQQLGFFEDQPRGDGHARNAFHRLITTQSPVAEEFAPLLLKGDFSDLSAFTTARVGWSSFDSHEARRVFLARCLPYVLFKCPTDEQSEDQDDDEVETAPDSVEWLRPIAEACLTFLTHAQSARVRGNLSKAQTTELLTHLGSALRRREYEEPFPAPPLPPGQALQTLFPAHRLNAFHRLLHSTN